MKIKKKSFKSIISMLLILSMLILPFENIRAVEKTNETAESIVNLFRDDFSNDLSKWENTSNAKISNGKLNVKNNENMRSKTGKVWTNYSIEMDLDVGDSVAGVVFRSKDNYNYYMWQFSKNGKVVPHTRVNGWWTVIKRVDPKIECGSAYHIKIDIVDNIITTYINGNLVDKTTDDTYKSGGIGIREDQGEGSTFDNITVTDKVKKYSYNGNLYAKYDIGLTWTEANAFCGELGGHLVTIKNKLEQSFIESTVLEEGKMNLYSIGGYRNSNSDHWHWVTGEEFNYTKWAPGEPKTIGEFYVQMFRSDGKWNDITDYISEYSQTPYYATTKTGFICEWENSVKSTFTEQVGASMISKNLTCTNGDPVDVLTGNFFTGETDLSISGKQPLEFYRFYNAQDTWSGALGDNWHHNFEITLKNLSDTRTQITFDDGHTEDYVWNGTDYITEAGVYNVLSKLDSGEYKLTTGKQTVYCFNKNGNLTAITDSAGNTITLTYNKENQLVSAENKAGSLTFSYQDGRLYRVTDSADRTMTYSYEKNLLTQVKKYDNTASKYTYDTEGKMLTEADEKGTVLLKNTYDDKDRVIEQTMTESGTCYFSYNDEDLTTTYTDFDGNKTTYSRDKLGRVSDRSYTYGKEKVEFNERNQVVSVTDVLGNVTRYEYDENGNVSKETDALGNAKQYKYNSKNQLISYTDEDKNSSTYTYDENGNMLTATNPYKQTVSMTYNKDNLPETIQFEDGSFKKMAYDEKGNTLSVEDSEENCTHYEYTAGNLMSKMTDPMGNITSYEYDLNGNLTKTVHPDKTQTSATYDSNGNMLSETDECGNTTTYTYDSLNRNTSITDPSGKVTRYEYNKAGSVVKETQPDGGIITYKYDDSNRKISMTDAEEHTTSYSYDAKGNLISEKDGLGHTTTYKYDALGRKISETDALGQATQYEYDLRGNLIKTTDALGNEEVSKYDALGHLMSFKDKLGNTESYTYDCRENAVTTTDKNKVTTSYQYNSAGKLTKTKFSDGTETESQYDKNGNLTCHTDENGNKTTYTYDSRNRLIKTTNAAGQNQYISYTANGLTETVTDAKGAVTACKYDANGRLTKVTDALGNPVSYVYNSMGKLTELHQHQGVSKEVLNTMRKSSACTGSSIELITKYDYDKSGKLLKETSPTGKKKSYSYDAAGNLITTTDADDFTSSYEYDAADNITKVRYSDEKCVRFTYNALNQRTSMKDWTGTTSYEKNALDLVTKVTDPENKETLFSWTPSGKRKSMTYPDKTVVTYDYDEKDRLVSVTDPENGKTEYTYDAMGKMTNKVLPNGITSAYTYDNLSQLVAQKDTNKEGHEIHNLAYAYDGAGNKARVTENGTSTAYEYDALNQLILESKESTSRKYFYDTVGNRIQTEAWEKRDGTDSYLSTDQYVYNKENQLTSSTEAGHGKTASDTETAFQYDNRGNLIEKKTAGAGSTTYTFDETNALVSSADVSGLLTKYVYNGTRDRVKKTVEKHGKDTEVCQYTNDVTSSDNRVLLVSQKEEGTHRYVYGRDVLSVDRYCYLEDHLGSIHALTDAEGAAAETFEYDLFGEPSAENGKLSEAALFGFAGYQYDGSNGLYYIQNRYYNPGQKTFISKDMCTGNSMLPLTLNRYVYCLNNPLRYVDVQGKSARDVVAGMSGAIKDNMDPGFVKQMAEKLMGSKSGNNYNYDNEFDYYAGRVIGDVVCLIMGTGISVKGGFDFMKSIITGGAITVGSGGTLAIGGVTICVGGAAVGTAEVTIGTTTVAVSSCSLGKDIKQMNEAKRGGGGNAGLPTVKKAINSNLPHAVERAVERNVFNNEEQASDALRKLSEKITKEGFPSNAILDTAHADRVLVPVGNNGMAVYQVAKNGTAKLKTILIAK